MNPNNGHVACWTVRILTPVLTLGAAHGAKGGERCVTNENGPDICVAFDEGTPILNQDFSVDYSDSSSPSVSLRTASLSWNVRSKVGSNEGNMGNLTLDPSIPSSGDFGVSIFQGDGPGALDIGSLNLTKEGWTGHSSFTGGMINGDVNGDLVVQQEAGLGGTVDLLIQGDVKGNVTMRRSVSLQVFGGVLGSIYVTDRAEFLEIDDAISGTVDIDTARSVYLRGDVSGPINVDRVEAGLHISGNTLGAIDVGVLSGNAFVTRDCPVCS